MQAIHAAFYDWLVPDTQELVLHLAAAASVEVLRRIAVFAWVTKMFVVTGLPWHRAVVAIVSVAGTGRQGDCQ